MNLNVCELTTQAPAVVTYYNAVIVSENHLRFVVGRHFRVDV